MHIKMIIIKQKQLDNLSLLYSWCAQLYEANIDIPSLLIIYLMQS